MEDDGNPKICDDKMMAAWYSASEGGEATGWRELDTGSSCQDEKRCQDKGEEKREDAG